MWLSPYTTSSDPLGRLVHYLIPDWQCKSLDEYNEFLTAETTPATNHSTPPFYLPFLTGDGHWLPSTFPTLAIWTYLKAGHRLFLQAASVRSSFSSCLKTGIADCRLYKSDNGVLLAKSKRPILLTNLIFADVHILKSFCWQRNNTTWGGWKDPRRFQKSVDQPSQFNQFNRPFLDEPTNLMRRKYLIPLGHWAIIVRRTATGLYKCPTRHPNTRYSDSRWHRIWGTL